MELRREHKLLLDCLKANGNLDPEPPSSLERLTLEDWNQVVQQSIRHGVAPLLYFRLGKPRLQIPPVVLQRLRALYLGNVAKNLLLYQELSKLLKVLKNENVPVIILKGAYLGEAVYENTGLRSMSDVDLLVKKKDLSRAQKHLMDAGYTPFNKQINLDLQWNIESSANYLSIDMEKVWERTQPSFVAGVEAVALSPEDLLLHLCLHLSYQHLFQGAGVRSLCDIKQTIEHYRDKIRWDQVCKLAGEWGVGNSVYLTLSFVRDLLDAKIPEGVIANLTSNASYHQVKEWALGQIFQVTGGPALSPFFSQLWKSGSFLEKTSLLRKLLLPAPEIISQDYPAPFGSIRNYLYYAVRFVDHSRRYARATWLILNKDEETTQLVRRQNQSIAMREWLASK